MIVRNYQLPIHLYVKCFIKLCGFFEVLETQYEFYETEKSFILKPRVLFFAQNLKLYMSFMFKTISNFKIITFSDNEFSKYI